ncbi:hypothetical protein FL857_06645 [Criibacterium bergeronii]|uniref:YoaR-like putative peptidoglycan binding domain-containing protein n=1 Tax=Criibacterium bergeronii TaxID=1871336 RepID=A0A552V6L2_9FIRM|nr:VanW family protein [Criibacterium bergeronii]TRW26091.1 hypothetical protein FL857_06645 [Criibacterium bergeronii]
MVDTQSNDVKTEKSFQKKLTIILLILSTMVLVCSFSIFFYYLRANEFINPNIYINGLDVSNLTVENAKSLITKKLRTPNLIIQFEDKRKENVLQTLDFKYDYDVAANQAYQIGRRGNFIIDAVDIVKQNLGAETNIPLDKSYDEKKLMSLCDSIEKALNKEPFNANIVVNQGEINVMSGKNGVKVNKEELKDEIVAYIDSNTNIDKIIPVPFIEIKPKITRNDLLKINAIKGIYTTTYADAAIGRAYNIRLTSSKITDKIVMPGEEISFLNSVGEISYKTGFQNDKIIVNGEYVDGIGGGICQVSSTLYNALRNAGVTITQRTTHSLPVHYVPQGMDATVAINGPDLVYKNNFDYPVYVKSYTTSSGNRGKITVEIYGQG